MALEDLAMFRAVPNACVLYPSDAVSTERLVETMARTNAICYLRTSRPKTAVLYGNDEQFPLPGFKVLRESANDRATIIGAGVTLHEALKACEQLKAKGIAARVLDLYCLKPIDGAAISTHVRATGGRLVIAEDHYAEGGVGEAVLAALAAVGIAPGIVKHLAVNGVPHSGKPEELLEAFGISARHIAAAVEAIA
jgi:transketolase